MYKINPEEIKFAHQLEKFIHSTIGAEWFSEIHNISVRQTYNYTIPPDHPGGQATRGTAARLEKILVVCESLKPGSAKIILNYFANKHNLSVINNQDSDNLSKDIYNTIPSLLEKSSKAAGALVKALDDKKITEEERNDIIPKISALKILLFEIEKMVDETGSD